jgi:thioredoxin reductase/Fe-S-cluster-containing dehydrogenase component
VVVLVQHSLVNPTLVNGNPVSDRHRLASGDEIQIAQRVVVEVQLREAGPAVDRSAGSPVEREQSLPDLQEAQAADAPPSVPEADPRAAEAPPQRAADAAPPPREPEPPPEAVAPPSERPPASPPAATPTDSARGARSVAPAPPAHAAASQGSGSLPEQVKIAIVGAGPAGIAAAVQAATRGVSHVLLERQALAHTVERYQKGKWVMDEPPRLPLREELAVRFEAGTREDVLAEWQRGVREAEANRFIGADYELMALEGSAGAFELSLRGGRTLRAESVVLSIGVQGNLRQFGVPGEDLPHVSYQLDDPAEHEGERVVVVGVGDAGIENALALAEYGNQVSIINRRSEFDRAKPRNRALIENAIKTGAITHYTNATTLRFGERSIVLRTNNGEVELEADLVIGRLGAIPPRAFLESAGIAFPSEDRESVPEVDADYASNVPGLHLIGAVVGYPLIKNCMNQGFEVVEHILGNRVIPADESVLQEKFAGLEGSVRDVLERIRATIPVFSHLTTIQLREFLFESTVSQLAAHDVVYRRNDFTNTFFAVLEGSLEVQLPASDIDQDMDLRAFERSERRATIETGEFFGEAGLISGRRRTGTVVASTDCVLIETPRTTMNRLIRSVEDVRRTVDATFISRTLQNLCPEASPEARAKLCEAAEIHVYKAGETLFEEGSEPEGLHLLRRGAVTISQRIDDIDQVIQYTQAGHYLGETSLLSQGRTRSASVRATVLTETVLLPAAVMIPFIQAHPQLKQQIEQYEREYAVADAQRRAERGRRGTVNFLMSKGAHEATDLLLIDESLCVRCDNCEKACAETHGGVSRLDREAGATYATRGGSQLHIPTACQHCENPHCMNDCPPDALRRDPNGEVYIKDNCIGCGNCVVNCPYDVIQMAALHDYRPPGLLGRLLFGARPRTGGGGDDGASEKAVKCDLCRNQPEMRDGRDKAACVASCPTGAIVRVNPRSYVDELLTTT